MRTYNTPTHRQQTTEIIANRQLTVHASGQRGLKDAGEACRPTFDEQPELVGDDRLDEVVKVTHVDARVTR